MTTHGGVVLDASAAVTWVLRDGKPEHEERIDEEFVVGVCEQLDQLDIRTDVVRTQVQRLTMESRARDLTAYDTAYLLLAKDRGLPLAQAAATAGVALAL